MSGPTPTGRSDPAETAAWKEKIRSVGVMRRTTASSREPQLARDRDAYARLRREGLQPRTVAGSAELEATADHRHEIEMGHVFPADMFPDRSEVWKRVDDGLAAGRDMEEFRQKNEGP